MLPFWLDIQFVGKINEKTEGKRVNQKEKKLINFLKYIQIASAKSCSARWEILEIWCDSSGNLDYWGGRELLGGVNSSKAEPENVGGK